MSPTGVVSSTAVVTIFLAVVALGISPASAQHSAAGADDAAARAAGSSGEGSAPGARQPLAQPSPAGASRVDSSFDALNRKPEEGSLGQGAVLVQQRSQDKMIAAEALGLGRLEDPAVRAHFDRYLGMPEVTAEALKAYAAQLEKVNALLQKDQVFEAWKQLFLLADFKDIDAGVSRELANRIESIWNTGRAQGHIENRNKELRQEIRSTAWTADSRMDSIRRKEAEWRTLDRESGKGGGRKSGGVNRGNNGGVPMVEPDPEETAGVGDGSGGGGSPMAGLEGRLQLTEDYLRTLEAKAKIKLNELKMRNLLDAAKADFSAYIGDLFQSHRYQHVVLAADFYRRIFKEEAYPVELAKQVNASLEKSLAVRKTLEAFRFLLEQDELVGATDRLQEAFIASEYHPDVLNLSRADKVRIARFTQRLSKMQNLIEAHNFGALEKLLKETEADAKDFDSSKPLALVDAVKLESRLRLGKAKLAAQKGDTAQAMEEFQAAAKAWPANPQLEEAANLFFEKADTKNQFVTEFDRMVAEQNIRGIFENQLKFAPAIAGDAKREEALKAALEKIKQAEIAHEKAILQRNAGDVFGAWETIEAATTDLPNDNKLNMLRAELSGKGAEFVAAINKAKDAEAKKQTGFALSCFAVAQRHYPASSIANAGLQRLTQMVFNEGAGAGARVGAEYPASGPAAGAPALNAPVGNGAAGNLPLSGAAGGAGR